MKKDLIQFTALFLGPSLAPAFAETNLLRLPLIAPGPFQPDWNSMTNYQFTAYQSSDGIEWFKIGQSSVALPRSVLAGVLASGGGTPPGRKATDAAKGIFDHVTIERQPPTPPAAPSTLAATPLGDGVVCLDWKNASGNSQSGVKIEASLDGAPFYEIADLVGEASRFENTGIERSSALRYRVRAYNTGGYSAYSNIARSRK